MPSECTGRRRGAVTRRAMLFGRGWLQVALVAANTYQIAHALYVGAFIIGFGISMVWWFNAGSSGRSTDWRDGPFYALGAASGTVSGLLLTRWWYGL
jgi:hypothetical protein